MNIEIIEFENDDINPLIDECFKFSLMAENYMEKIETFFIAKNDNEIVGFLARGYNDDCILVEVKENFRRKGIGTDLVKKSGACQPRQNGCPEFWEAVEASDKHIELKELKQENNDLKQEVKALKKELTRVKHQKRKLLLK